MDKNTLKIEDLGLIAYGKALEIQQEYNTRRIAEEVENCVFLVEHKPVITLGARKPDNKLLTEEPDIIQQGIEIFPVRRGGAVTAHNPGQMVIYPIVKLKAMGLDVSQYVRTLEQIGIDLLNQYGILAGRKKKAPGLWIQERKIASIGVQVKRWVTMHGMAINIINDLSIFDHMIPCGLEGVEMTSVEKEMNIHPPMTEVKEKITDLCIKYLSTNPKLLTTNYERNKND